jgi:hypothetical protein
LIDNADSSKDRTRSAARVVARTKDQQQGRTDGRTDSSRVKGELVLVLVARTATVMWGFGIAVAEGGDHGSTWLTFVKPSR